MPARRCQSLIILLAFRSTLMRLSRSVCAFDSASDFLQVDVDAGEAICLGSVQCLRSIIAMSAMQVKHTLGLHEKAARLAKQTRAERDRAGQSRAGRAVCGSTGIVYPSVSMCSVSEHDCGANATNTSSTQHGQYTTPLHTTQHKTREAVPHKAEENAYFCGLTSPCTSAIPLVAPASPP